jgi:hypothetical protein
MRAAAGKDAKAGNSNSRHFMDQPVAEIVQCTEPIHHSYLSLRKGTK